MGWHEALSEDEQAAFTLGLRPLLNSVWEGVLGDPAVYTAVNRGLAEYMLSDYCHNDRLLGPEDAYEPAAAATLNAALRISSGAPTSQSGPVAGPSMISTSSTSPAPGSKKETSSTPTRH
ncbi:hypothetical protein OHB39_36950 [Streptomyces sp. NBC_00047]|uniref:hypothetical protein n=1 Tax=Streptomyces sp. NBC_00047 TaxID=2975627 RepID=UPI00225193B9|nr:hypothetical protein [Streptomyces sp. NBC_00047]MCX5613089.1 hypothetical protein [Streptomyces sp. NBC_00047]